jgi:hypothetical protein
VKTVRFGTPHPSTGEFVEEFSVEQFVEHFVMEGKDDFYDRHNGIEDRIKRLAEVLGNLVSTLSDKGILSDKEMLEVVLGKYHSDRRCQIVDFE